MHPRYRTRLFLPCLLTLLLLALPGQAFAAPGFAAASACSSTPGDALTGATDTTAGPSGWQNADITLNLTGTGVTGWEWMVDCSPVQSGPAGTSVIINGNGTHIISHRAHDGSGLWTDWSDTTIQLDKGVPSNTTAVPSSWSTTPVTVHVTGSDAVSSIPLVHWNLDGAGWNSGPSNSSVVVSGDGSHSLQTWVEDAAGNQSTPRTDTVGIDATVPVDTTVVPSGWQYADTYITVQGTDATSGVSHVEWKIDGVLATGGNGASVHMPEGSHSFETAIVDGAGNRSAWTSATVMVDTTGPHDDTVVPATWQTTGTVNVTVIGSDPNGSGIDHVEWELDTVPGSAIGASHVVSVTGDGDHILTTRVIDNGGDASGWSVRHVKIDTVLPADLTTTSAGWQTQPVDVDVAGSDANSGVDHVEWQLDGSGTQTAVGNPHSVHVSGDGQHTLLTRVVDVAGNVSGWRTTTVAIDASAPHNTTPTTTTAWRQTQYQVLLSGDDDVSGMREMRYTIDGGVVHAGPSGFLTATVTGTGSHTLTTWAVDQAGNTSGLRNETINIDGVAPSDTTTAPGTPVTNHYPVTINGSDAHSGVNVVKWKLDGGAVQTGAPGSVVDIAGNGPHTLETMVVDNAGNDSGWKTITITVDISLSPDTTAPTDTTTTAPAGWSPASVDMTVKATDAGVGVDYVQWRLDGVLSTKRPTGTVVTISGDGSHTLETRAADLAGNLSAWRSQTVRIDSAVPSDTSAMPAAGAWSNTRSFVLSGTDATSGVATIEYQLDGGGTLTTTNGGSVTLPSDGAHTINHRVLDAAGQATPWVLSSVQIDTVLPVNTSAAAPTAWQTASGVSLALTGTDALSGVDHAEWRVDGGTVTSGSPAVVSADGIQLLETRIVDRAGNASAWRGETVKIDRTAPVNTTPVPAGGWQNTNYSASVAGSDATSGVAGVEWKLDGGATVTTPSVSIATSGAHTLLSRIRDNAGNYSAWRSDSVGIDKVVPTLTVNCGSVDWRSTPATCSVVGDGGASGLSALTASVEGGAADAISGGSYTVGSDGSHSLTFRAVDGAGNEKLALAQVKIDLTPPAATVSCTAGQGTTYVCAATGSDALSGLAGLSWSVDGSAPTAVTSGATFTVAKGTVTVSASDKAGNIGTSAPVTLKARTVAPAPTATPPKTTPKVTPRTASEAVLRRGKGTIAKRALGQLEISALPSSTTATLRPLALGKGTFRISIKVTADKKSKSSAKTYSTRSGYSPLIKVTAGGAVDVKVTLTVRKRSGKRWLSYAAGTVKL